MNEKKLLLINIAGFASDGKNKFGQLKKMFPDAKVVNIITSGIDPDEVIIKVLTEVGMHQGMFPIMVGSSLGGLYAYMASSKIDCYAVLINPSMKPWETLKDKVGINSFFNGNTFELKQKHLDRLERLFGKHDNVLDHIGFALFTGSDDRQLDHAVTREILRSPIVDCVVAGYDHRFEDISIIKSAIELLEKRKIAVEDDSFSPHDPFGDNEKQNKQKIYSNK